MDHAITSAYGLWSLVIVNSVIFILFAFSFTKPRTSRDWRTLGMFSAFIVALFTEMYGFPLTVYLLSGWLTDKYPGLDIFSHDSGHLWHTLLGLEGNAHFDVLHILSNVLIVSGFWLLATAWKVLYTAQLQGTLAQTGPLRPNSTPPVPGIYDYYVRISAAMAHNTHADHVSSACVFLYTACPARRGSGPGVIW